jgi:diguanylate cyclase (GGDEF)-like protein
VRRAFIDALTGLPNRRALTERLQHALAVSRRRGTTVGVLHLDVDRFTAVNDSLGHEGGDELLCQVADRLRWSTRVEDMAVRFGADEFLVLAEEVEDVDALRTLADRLLGVLDEPFHVRDREITLSASVGVTLGTDLAPEALLRQAHSALARAKASGGRAGSRCTTRRSPTTTSTSCSWRPICAARSRPTSCGCSTNRSSPSPTSTCSGTRR